VCLSGLALRPRAVALWVHSRGRLAHCQAFETTTHPAWSVKAARQWRDGGSVRVARQWLGGGVAAPASPPHRFQNVSTASRMSLAHSHYEHPSC